MLKQKSKYAFGEGNKRNNRKRRRKVKRVGHEKEANGFVLNSRRKSKAFCKIHGLRSDSAPDFRTNELLFVNNKKMNRKEKGYEKERKTKKHQSSS